MTMPTGQSSYGQPSWYDGSRLASWIARVGASIVDLLILVAVAVPFVILGVATADEAGNTSPGVFLLIYLAPLGFAVYQLVRQGRTGQTIGKRVVNIRALRERDGLPMGAGLSIARAILHIVDQLPLYLGYLWPLWDSKKQTFADKLVGTVVVKD